MKLATALIASAAVLLGVAACASPSDEDREDTESTTQGLCPVGRICRLPSSSGWLGGSSGDLVVVDGTGSTSSSGGTTGETIACNIPSGGSFTCGGPSHTCGVIAKTTTPGCNMQLRCVPNVGCDCIPGCGGGGWTFGSWNPCMYGRTYTCDPSGYCRCS